MNKNICYGCMKSFVGNVCSCGWKYDYSQEEQESLLIPGMVLNFGNYRVGRKLGRGGFGVTYIGMQQSELGLRVAIKEYYPKKIAYRNMNFSPNLNPLYRPGMTELDKNNISHKYEEGKRGFIEEAKRLVELNELSTIVSVLGYFEENHTAYIIMEYIDGIDLYKHMRNNGRTLKLKEVESIIYPIIQDLYRVHEKGIIHRDISPDNIMLTKSGNVKLIDFGASVTQETEEVKVLRKNGFAPLEQYETNTNSLGAWTDVYAMCATIYYLLSGKMIPDARDRQFFDRYETLNEQSVILPSRLDKVLKKGLAIDWHKRYASMKELIQQLNKVHDRRRIKPWIFAGGVLLVSSFAMIAGYWQIYLKGHSPAFIMEPVMAEGTYLKELFSRKEIKQADSASNYAVYDDLVYIRYSFEDGTVMLVRSPIGTDDFNSVEYVTDGAFDRFCVEGDYLYFTLTEDKFLYRVNIADISTLPDEQQRITAWKESGKLEKVSSYPLDTEYGFTITQGYAYSVIHSGNGNSYEILRASLDGTENLVTAMQLNLSNCIFYNGYLYMTVAENGETALKRMCLDGSYFEELARYSGEIPAMRIADGEIYYLLNAVDNQSESWLGKISVNGSRDEKLSVRTEEDLEYCYMTGVVDGSNIYYTCSLKGTEAVNNLYCYSLENGSNKQISSECGRYIVTSDEIDSIIFASMDGSEIRQMNKDGSNPHVMRGEDGTTGIEVKADITSLAIIKDHVYYLDGGSVAYKEIIE